MQGQASRSELCSALELFVLCLMASHAKSCGGRWTEMFKSIGSTGAGVGGNRQGKLPRFVCWYTCWNICGSSMLWEVTWGLNFSRTFPHVMISMLFTFHVYLPYSILLAQLF